MPEAEHAKDATERSARAQARFLEYSATGRPDALAEVFDLCAPELLLVAHHLAAPGVPAEDLIQQTFLVAIQNADRFDGLRPLMPWLCGILVNVARNANRRSRRSDAVAARPELERDDPAEVAQVRELAAETLRAIDDLPARQREVLTLRLVHGLTPTEIAHALREPVGTVKSWIHRGVERLRTLLPAGFAAALVLLVGGDRSLASAREAVLAEAAARGSEFVHPHIEPAPAPAGGASSSWVPARPSVGVAVAAAVAVFVGALWLGARSPTAAPERVAAAQPEDGFDIVASPMSVRVDPSVGAASDQDTRTAAAPWVAAHHADGSPAGIAFRLEPQFGVEPSFRDVEARTGADGRAHVGDLEPGPYRLVPDRGVPSVVELGARAESFVIELQPGIRIEGRVRDGAGNPVAGAGIWLSEHDAVAHGMIATVTDRDGRYSLRDVPPRRNLAVLASGFEATPLRQVVTSDEGFDAGAVTHDFVLERRCAPFVCEVREPDGRPARGALVQLGAGIDASHRRVVPRHALYPTRTLRTDENGLVRADSPPPFPFRVWARSPSSTILETSASGSETEFVLRLGAGASWRGEVSVAADTRVALEARSAADQRRSVDDVVPPFATPRAFTVGASAVELAGIVAGDVELWARAADRSAYHAVVPRTGDVVAWSPSLEATGEVRGLALDDAGAPLVGHRIVVATDEGTSSPVEVAADGRFRVVAPGGRVVWIHGKKGVYPGTLAHRVLDGDAGDVVLRVARERLPSATLRVRVFDLDGTPSGGVRIVSAADATQIQGRRDPEGWTTFQSLPAGAYFVAVLDEAGTRLVHGPITLARAETREIDALRIAPPGRVRVRAADRQARPLDDRFLVTTLDGAFVVTLFDAVDGQGTSPPVPPGSYHVISERSLGAVPIRVDVGSDATAEATWVVDPLPEVELRVTHPELCGGLRLHVTWTQDGAADGARRSWTDAVKLTDGVIGEAVLHARANPGSYRIDVRSCEGLVGSARFDLTVDPRSTRVVVPLRETE